jgi:DNA-binding NtrC family response regulator
MSPSVLIVDDDAGAIETLTDIFAAKQYRVGTASSGDEAVGLVRRSRYDAVLMDILMPGLNGVDAMKAMKVARPDIAVIMMTAFTRHQLVEEAQRATALAVLAKPLDLDQVLALVDDATRPRADRGGE